MRAEKHPTRPTPATLTVPAYARRYFRDTLTDALVRAEDVLQLARSRKRRGLSIFGPALDAEIHEVRVLRDLTRQALAQPKGTLRLVVAHEDRETVRRVFRRQARHDVALLARLEESCQDDAAVIALDRLGWARSCSDQLAVAA